MAEGRKARPIIAAATLAVLMMLVANLGFAIVDTSTKWLLGLGYAALQLAFLRYAVQFAVTCGLLAWGGDPGIRQARPHFPMLIFRGSLLIASTILNFVALQFLSLTVTSAIMFSAPIIVCALSGPLLNERVGQFRWTAVMLGFAGVLVVIRPFESSFSWAAGLMLFAATGLALYSLMTRKLAQDVAPLIMQFILGLTGTLVLAPFAWVFWVAPETPFDAVLMAGLGLFAWGGHELLIRAHKLQEANYLMPYTYSYLIFMTAASLLVFKDVPDVWTLAGAAMIAGSGLAIWWRERMLTAMKARVDQDQNTKGTR